MESLPRQKHTLLVISGPLTASTGFARKLIAKAINANKTKVFDSRDIVVVTMVGLTRCEVRELCGKVSQEDRCRASGGGCLGFLGYMKRGSRRLGLRVW
jgi:hypothetical protein